MIRGDSELTSVHPKELCSEAPLVPRFQPCQGSARPCKPWQACGSQPVFIYGNALCNISNASHQLLTADSYRCLVSSLKRQEKQIEWGKLETQRTRAEPKWEDNVALMRKVAKMRQKRSRTRNLCMRRLRSMSERTQPQPPPFKLNWLPKYFSDELGFVCCSVRWSHPLLCSGPAALQLWQFAWPGGKEDWLGCFKVTLSCWDVVCWFFF